KWAVKIIRKFIKGFISGGKRWKYM
nr:Chain A, Unconventional myosin-Ih, Transcription activator BRG1 intragenic antimicrobial chimeric peptide [Homo sapiens]